MNSLIFPHGDWICPECASALQPTDILAAQHNAKMPVMYDSLKNRHFLFRKRFNYKHNGEAVKLRVTADDYYKFTINGRIIGQGPAQGYSFCYYWNEYNLSGMLKNGENEIMVDVYYHGLPCRAYNSGDNRIGLIAEIRQGNKCILCTGCDWEYADYSAYGKSQVTGADTYFPEDFDSRAELIWRSCYSVDSDYTFSPEPVKPVVRYPQKPLKEKRLEDGSIFYDFGREITAMLEIKAKGNDGDSVFILCGEEAEGTDVRYKLRCNCEYKEKLILSDGENSHEQYDYKGFRYVKLIPCGNISELSLTAVVRHYPFDDKYCILKTCDAQLKSIFEMCKNSVKYGAQEVYIDCPTREKGQYSGDLLVTGSAHMILTGNGELFKKALDNFMQSSGYSETLLAVAPGSYLQEIADYSLIFPLLASQYYKFSDDRAYLCKNLEICRKIINGFKVYERRDGLLCGVNDKWNLVDWPAELRDGYDFRLEPPDGQPHNVLNALYIGCVILTEKISEILGIAYPKRSKELITSFNAEFYDPASKIYTDCKSSGHSALHSNILPVFFDFAEKEAQDNILKMVMNKGLSCGVYFSYFVLKALCKTGRYNEALELILSDGRHSWLHMLSEGATTCFEAWGKEQKHNTSLCHPWASAPIIVLAEDILPNIPSAGEIIYGKRLNRQSEYFKA